MKNNWMRAVALLLAMLLVSALMLTACNDDDNPTDVPPVVEPKTAESVLSASFAKLGTALADAGNTFELSKNGSVALSADLTALLPLLTGVQLADGETFTVALKGFFSGALTLDAALGERKADAKLFLGETGAIFTSDAFASGKAYSVSYEELIPMLLSLIDFGGDDPIDGPEEDLYYLGDPEDESIWYVFEGKNAAAVFPMDTYVVGDFDTLIAVFQIADAAEVIPYEPTDIFENYEYKDNLYYVFGDEALYGFTADTECITLDPAQFVTFYGNDGTSYVIFDKSSYSYIDDGSLYDDFDTDPDYDVDVPTDALSLLFGQSADAVREILDYVKANADALIDVAQKALDAAGTSFKTNSARTLEEAKPLTVHNRELTVDNVTITVTEKQILAVAADTLNAIKSEAALTGLLSKVSALVGEELTVDALIEEIRSLTTEQAEKNCIAITVSVDTETGLPAKAVVTISDYSKELEDVPRNEVFDLLTVEYLEGYIALTVGEADGPLFRIDTTWNTDAERTMAQTFVYLPMEDTGKLGEELMIDWTFYADKTYDISIVTGDLTMITLKGSYASSATETSVELATVSVQSGEFQVTLPIHAVLTLKAADEAPAAPTDVIPVAEADPLELMLVLAQFGEFLSQITGEYNG